MSDAPTLTDKQIDAIITGWREGNRHLRYMQSEGLMDPADSDAAFDAQLAAVIARAKREERSTIVGWLRANISSIQSGAPLTDIERGAVLGWQDAINVLEAPNDPR